MSTTTISIKDKYTAAVALGATFLDTEEPGWFTKIAKDRLSFPSLSNCVLGQLRGNYHNALNDLGKSGRWGIEHGFAIDSGTDLYATDFDYEELTNLWIAEIGKREGAL